MIKTALLFCLMALSLYANAQNISVQFEWKHQFEFAGFYAAKEKGYYKDVDLNVSFIEYADGIDITQEVLSNNATFGISSSSLILEKLQGKPVVLLASYFKQNALAILAQAEIKSPKDLKNKKIMAVPWELDHSGLGVMLLEFGITKDDYQLINHDYQLDKFINGEIDAMSIFITNQPYYLDQLGINYTIFNPASFGIFSYDLELFTSQELLYSNPQMVKDFIQATNKGWEYALDNKKEIVDLIYEKYTQRKSKGALMYEAHKTETLFKRSIFKIGAIAPELIKLNVAMYEKLGLLNDDFKLKELISGYIFDKKHTNPIHFTDQQKEFLKNKKTFTIAYKQDAQPFFIQDKRKQYSGYIGDLFKNIQEMSHLTFTINDTNTSSDITIKKSFSGMQAQDGFYSDALLKFRPLLITTSANPKKIHKIQDLQSKTVVIKKDETCFEKLLLQNNIADIKIIYAKNTQELLEILSSNHADAAVIDEGSLYLAKRIALEKMIEVQFSLRKYFDIVLHTDSKQLQGILNTLLEHMDPKERLKLKEKWFTPYKNEINLLPKEIEYLLAKKEIRYCIDPHWLPFEGKKATEHIGLSADYFKLFEKNLNTKLTLVHTKDWAESLEFIKEKKCDVLPLSMKTPNRENFMDFTKPYIFTPFVLVTKKDVTFIEDLSHFERIKDKKIGIAKDHAFNELFKQKYKNMQIVDVKDVYDGLSKVQDGAIYAYAGTLYNIALLFEQKYYADLKVTGKFDEEWELSIAVRNDEPILTDIFNKAIDQITPEQKKNILNKWIAVKYEQEVDYTLIRNVILLSLLIFLIIFFWNRRLAYLNKELTKAREDADEATQVKSNFLANMSHEVRTPMNAILGMIHFMKNTKLTETQQNYLQKIEQSSRNLLILLDDVLDFSKIEAKKLQLHTVDFNLVDILYHLEGTFRTKADENGIVFEIHYDETLTLQLHGDSHRLTQILTNFLSNALKFTDQGSVVLSIKQLEPELFSFCVKDTGIGISKEEQQKLFEPFTQADESTTRTYGGTGLGLSISKELAQLMGGRIILESIPEQGSSFILEIPLKPSSQAIKNLLHNSFVQQSKTQAKEQLTQAQIDTLFESLDAAVTKRRPQLCAPILQQLEHVELSKEQNALFEDLKTLIQSYKFDQAKEKIDASK